MPETLKQWKPYQKADEDAGSDGRIVVPLLPFGIKKYDEVCLCTEHHLAACTDHAHCQLVFACGVLHMISAT